MLSFYYKPDIELVPLTLKDVGDLKRCGCLPNTHVSTSNSCSNCYSPEYNNEVLKEAIAHLRINDNAKIMVYMLDILSNLQRRRSDEVIRIIEKIFLEAFSEPVFQPIKPTFDLIHFIVFNLVEDYDYVKLTQIFIDFLKRSLRVDMNLTEILMLFLLKDNLILSTDKEQVYDYQNTTSIYKRQICNSGVYSKEKKMLVKYLSLSTSYLAVEPQLSDDLVTELQVDINSQWKMIAPLPFEMVRNILHFPLYFTQGQGSIALKIQDHAANSNISADISGLIYHFTMIAYGTVSSKKALELFLRRSPAFNTIKEKFEVSFKELFGVIYMMKGDTHNEYFDRIISFILKKDSLLPMKKHVDMLLTLYASSDRTRIKKALNIFHRFCHHSNREIQFAALSKIFGHFKGTVTDEDEQLKLAIGEFFDLLPSQRSESDPKLKAMFTDCIYKKNLSKYRNFKENMLYLNKSLAKAKNQSELTTTLNILELFFDINFGTDFHQILLRFKEFVPEFEVNSLSNLCIKLLKTVNGFKAQNKDVISERLKESFNSLAEIMIGRPNDLENLWVLVYSSDNTAKLSALNSFVEIKKLTSGVDDERFRHHTIYIDKRVKFMKNQLRFVQQFLEQSKHSPYQFGITVIKRLFLKGFRIGSQEIAQILADILTKKNPAARRNIHDIATYDGVEEPTASTKKPLIQKGVESNKLTLFYAALMDFTLNQDGGQLGAYFLDEHDEPMLKILALCRYSASTNEVINRIFEQLMKNNHHRLCALLYFYYLIIGMVQRRKINLKLNLEQVINEWVNIKPELLEFIELYTDRKHVSMVDMIYKIQNRIFYNLYSDKELQKVTGILENLLTREFYMNIDTIISGGQPNITYLAELFKIPLNKMKFIYLLTTMKHSCRLAAALEQFHSNQDIRKTLELQAIDSQELVFLLKICLNEIDYDSITDLLRHMKLDQVIHPEVLINLLLLDLRVEKKPTNIKDFNKTLLVHSAIFDRLQEHKEVCWAYCRVLKGDFLIYSELMDLIADENRPQNHKYFAGIATGMIGVKNYIHFDEKTEKGLSLHGINHYHSVINANFSKFRKGEVECSLEYAQYLLQNCQTGAKIHPFWKLMVEVFSDANISKKYTSVQTKYKRIPFLKEANLIHFLMIYNLVNADVAVIEFIHDFAFLRNIHRFISIKNLSEKVHPENADRLADLQLYFGKKVSQYKEIMKRMIKDRKIVLNFEHFANKNSLVFQGFLMDVCKEEAQVQSSDFYLNLNKLIFQAWKQDLHRRCEQTHISNEEKIKIDRLTKKIEDLFRVMNLLVDPFTMFVTEENTKTKEYWSREFEELDNLDDYLDSMVNVLMKSLEELIPNYFNKYKLAQNLDIEEVQSQQFNFGRNQDAEYDRQGMDSEDEVSSTEEEMKDIKHRLTRKVSSLEDLQGDNFSMGVEWFGLPVYILLDRLRGYQKLSSEEKFEKKKVILFKSNILFGIIEKALYFYSAGASFRKYKYFREFNLSIGIEMKTKLSLRFAGSLFMPELQAYQNMLGQKLGADWNKSKTSELDTILIKCLLIKNVFENDEEYFPNKGIFAQFCYNYADEKSGPLVSDNLINLGLPKFDCAKFCAGQNLEVLEDEITPLREYYTLQFVARPEFRNIRSDERLRKISSIIPKYLEKDSVELDPTYTSVKLLKDKYYEIEGEPGDDPWKTITEMYLPKYTQSSTSKFELAKRDQQQMNDVPALSSKGLDMKENNIKFLNDISLGKYSVLSETKNIFTEQIELANHQKIYEAILHLHSAKRMTEWRRLITSLRILAPHLTSNVYNLNSVLEFVVEPSPSLIPANPYLDSGDSAIKVRTRDYYLFRELGLKNQSFFHIFLLQNYPNEIRVHYIQKIIEDLGIIDFGRIKQIIMYLLNLCYLVKCDQEATFSKEEFTVLAEGILGDQVSHDSTKFHKEHHPDFSGIPKSNEGGYRKMGLYRKTDEVKEGSGDRDNLIGFIYDRITSIEGSKKNDKSIDRFHALFEARGEQNNSKMSYDRGLIDLFNDFIMDITGKNKKSYLVKFEVFCHDLERIEEY